MGNKIQDPELQDLYCAWATEKFDFGPIVEVRFFEEYEYDYSEYTPGEGYYIDVSVKPEETNKFVHARHYKFAMDLLREIALFSQRQ